MYKLISTQEFKGNDTQKKTATVASLRSPSLQYFWSTEHLAVSFFPIYLLIRGSASKFHSAKLLKECNVTLQSQFQLDFACLLSLSICMRLCAMSRSGKRVESYMSRSNMSQVKIDKRTNLTHILNG